LPRSQQAAWRKAAAGCRSAGTPSGIPPECAFVFGRGPKFHRIEIIEALTVKNGAEADLSGIPAGLSAGDVLTLSPIIDGMFSGVDLVLEKMKITSGAAGTAAPSAKLPAVREGTEPGQGGQTSAKVAEGNLSMGVMGGAGQGINRSVR